MTVRQREDSHACPHRHPSSGHHAQTAWTDHQLGQVGTQGDNPLVSPSVLAGPLGPHTRSPIADLLETSLATALVAVGPTSILRGMVISDVQASEQSMKRGRTSLNLASGVPSILSFVSGSECPESPELMSDVSR